MKKTLSLLCMLCVVAIIPTTIIIASSTSENAPEEDIAGDWYEKETFNELILNQDNSVEYYYKPTSKSNGRWTIENNIISLGGLPQTMQGNLSIEETDNGLTLSDENRCFYRLYDLPWEDVKLNGDFVGDNVQIGNVQVEFIEELPNFIYDMSAHDESYGLSSSQVYADISFELNNLSKNELEVSDGLTHHCNVLLDYNNGFVFSNLRENETHYTDGSIVSAKRGTRGYGHNITMAPLEQKKIDIYIPCSNLLETDTSSPLVLFIAFTNENPACYFRCVIR